MTTEATPDLGPELNAEIDWPASDDPIPDSPMAAIYADTWWTHKFRHYIPLYENLFSAYRDRPIRFLELGVARGGSLTMWRRYFHPNSVIVGIDCNDRCAEHHNPANNVHVRIGYQDDTEFLQQVIDELGAFDIILDDASHLGKPTTTAFTYLFGHGLRDRGIYLVEDLGLSYIPTCPDLIDHTSTFIDVVKDLIDVMHLHYRRCDPPLTHAFQVYGDSDHVITDDPQRMRQVTVPLATTLVSGIHVYDGLAVIHRAPRALPILEYKSASWPEI